MWFYVQLIPSLSSEIHRRESREMRKYTLTSAARPRVSEGQTEILYKCLEPFGTLRTLVELISEARRRNYLSTFKREDLPIRESLLYHLNRFVKSGAVRAVEGQSGS